MTVMPNEDIHPELRRAARFIPRFTIQPWALPLVRTLTGLRKPSDVGVEVLTLPSGAGVRLHRPADSVSLTPALLWIHGGGYLFGTAAQDDDVCRKYVQRLGVTVAAVDYRLAPEHPAPAAADDAHAAYRWARAHAEELGADPGRVAVAGDSAGGNLAAVVSHMARDAGDPVPTLQWLIYPVTDMRGGSRSRSMFSDGFLLTKSDMDWFQDAYLEGSGLDVSHPMVSPLLAADLSGLPPALVTTAGFDPLRDEGEQYAAKLQEAGVKVDVRRAPGMTHAFLNLNVLGGGVADANARMISALRAHLARA